jgi:hypothetical protein
VPYTSPGSAQAWVTRWLFNQALKVRYVSIVEEFQSPYHTVVICNELPT